MLLLCLGLFSSCVVLHHCNWVFMYRLVARFREGLGITLILEEESSQLYVIPIKGLGP